MGKQAELSEEDLTKPLPEHKSANLGNKISKLWSEEVERAEIEGVIPSMTKVIAKCFYKEFLLYGFILFVMEVGLRYFKFYCSFSLIHTYGVHIFRIYQPLFIGLVLRYFDPKNQQNILP